VWGILGMFGSGNGHSRIGRSRYGPFWEWSVLGMAATGMVVLGLVHVPMYYDCRE
jgi:hypothetical protein